MNEKRWKPRTLQRIRLQRIIRQSFQISRSTSRKKMVSGKTME